MPAITATLFDLDGTLIDRLPSLRRFAGMLWDREPAVRAVDSRAAAIEKLVQFDGDGYNGRQSVMDMASERWPGMAMTPVELFAWYRKVYIEGFSPDPIVNGLLERLKRAGISVGIVTNGSAAQMEKIERTGIGKIVSAIVISDVFGAAKPDPAIFKDALGLVGSPEPSQTLFIGDNPVADISGAAATGMKSAWVRRGRHWPSEFPPPDYTVDHIREVAGIVGLRETV